MPPWIYPVAFIAGGFLTGFIFEKVVLHWLKKMAMKAKPEGGEILMASLRRWTTFWFTLTGIYGASLTLPLKLPQLLYIHKTLLVVAILSITIVISRIAVGFIQAYSRKVEGVLPSTSFLVHFTKLVIYFLGLLMILQAVGVSITPLLTALGVSGLAVALALQDTLSNFFSGLHILLSRQVRPGDYIKLSTGEEGYITDIAWRNTSIRAMENNLIIVPNSKLAGAIVTNYSLPQKEVGIAIQVTVSYNSDLKKVERITAEVAKEVMKEVPGGVPEFEPFIRFHTLGESGVDFSVILLVKEYGAQFLVKHEFLKRLQECYKQEGIEIPFPTRTLYVKGK